MLQNSKLLMHRMWNSVWQSVKLNKYRENESWKLEQKLNEFLEQEKYSIHLMTKKTHNEVNDGTSDQERTKQNPNFKDLKLQ